MSILDELFMKVTVWTQDINRTSWTSFKRFMYVQFRSCPQWVEEPFELLKLSKIKLLISDVFSKVISNDNWTVELPRRLNILLKCEMWEDWYLSK